ncbi:putative chemotaxis protein CheX [Bdellovibrio bacteriovorus W]|nr:putative chemotaxis protein CheX [Bdellovibrio bacteriovorus W]
MGAPKIEPLNPLFDKKLITAFVEGVTTTLKTMAQTDAQPGKPFIEREFKCKGEIAGMVGMVAPPLKGTLVISYGRDSIFHILENMLGEKYTEINHEVSDAVGEMTNMIYGCAKTSLNQLGYKFEMAIPTVISGDFKITQADKGATLVIPFNLPNNATFYVEISVQ